MQAEPIPEMCKTWITFRSPWRGNQLDYPEGARKRLIARREIIVARFQLLHEATAGAVIPPGRMENTHPAWVFRFGRAVSAATPDIFAS
jgi:hypothetical protein